MGSSIAIPLPKEKSRLCEVGRFSVLVAGIGFWIPQAPSRRQMAQIEHDVPNLVAVEDPFGGRHSRRFDPILDDRSQLAIRVALDLRRGERRDRRRHICRKRNTGILPVTAMTDHAIVPKDALSGLDIGRRGAHRITDMTATDRDVVFPPIDNCGFERAWLSYLTRQRGSGM